MTTACKGCQGQGYIMMMSEFPVPCSKCDGTGKILDIKVKITRKNAKVVSGSEVTQRTTRPIERIDDVLDEIKRVWRMYPDMRLTQLLWNLRPILPEPTNTARYERAIQTAFYNMEENQLLDRLHEHYGEPND